MGHHEKDNGGKYLGDAVYGALDGIVTTFAIVAGVAGASLSSSVILILGIANLLADGISMAAGNYLSKKSERDYYRKQRDKEKESIGTNPKEHKEHVRHIYAYKGFSGKLLEGIVSHITKDKDRWTDEMMSGEFGLHEETTSPVKSGVTTFAAFVVAGSVPLLSYILAIGFPFFERYSFVTAIFLTAWILFTVGSMRSILIKKNWFIAGLEMLIVGGLAAIVAYGIGALLGAHF